MPTGPDGQFVTAMVINHYWRMLNAARPFYAISVCNHFIQGLGRTLLPAFCSKYTNHSIIHDLDGRINVECSRLSLLRHKKLKMPGIIFRTSPAAC